MTPDSALEMLLSKSLISVCFVLDYVNFQFEDVVLSALSDPILIEGNDRWTRAGSGYHEALCRQIRKQVESVVDDPAQLQIRLVGGAILIIDLNAPEPPGPEMSTLSGRGIFHQAWIRPDLK